MIRISTGTGRVPPTRSITRSWMARNSLACRRTSISEISSSSNVPPLASSNLPMRRATAPVNAPFSWPNSSDSSSVSGMAAQLSANEGLLGPVRARVHIARQHLLAGARFAGNQHRCVARRDLQRQLHHPRHRVITINEIAGVVGDGSQHRGDQFRVRRQRNVFFGAGLNGGDRGAGVGRGAAGDDRRMDMFGFQCAHQVADGDGDIDHQEVGAAPGAQHRHRLRDVGGVGDRRALVHRELGRGGELAVESANDQKPHGLFLFRRARRSRMASGERRMRVIRFPPLFAIRHSLFACSRHHPRSALMISVMVTPSFSSTSTTSPRATRRLLT